MSYHDLEPAQTGSDETQSSADATPEDPKTRLRKDITDAAGKLFNEEDPQATKLIRRDVNGNALFLERGEALQHLTDFSVAELRVFRALPELGNSPGKVTQHNYGVYADHIDKRSLRPFDRLVVMNEHGPVPHDSFIPNVDEAELAELYKAIVESVPFDPTNPQPSS